MRYFKYVIGVTLFILGLSLVFFENIKNTLVETKQEQISLSTVSSNEIARNTEKEAEYDYSEVRAISAEDVLSSTIKGVDLNPIGGIAIPELGINLPILKGTTNDNLLFGAATMKEQEMGKGNYTLASHHVFSGAGAKDLLFSPLVKSKKGMEIYLTDKSKVYKYVIESIEVVEPTRVDLVDDVEGETLVTLFTCTDAEAKYRTVVRGSLQDVSPWNSSSSQPFLESK